MPYEIMKGGEPFLFEASDTACLLIHGFGGSPMEMKYLGEYLASKGITTHGVRLAGHATSPYDLEKTTWKDWYQSAVEGFEKLKDMGMKKIFVAGLSLGGLLTLYLAENNKDIDGIITMSSPAAMDEMEFRIIPIVDVFVDYVNLKMLGLEKKEFDLPHIQYDTLPMPAIRELIRFSKIVEKDLSKVTAPALIVHSLRDKTIAFHEAVEIATKISSEIRFLYILRESDHAVTLDKEREELYKVIEFFIKQDYSILKPKE